MRKKDLSGLIFGRLTVIKEVEPSKKSSRYECLCECGVSKVVFATNLVSGLTKSCGCLNIELTKEREMVHGLTNHPLYGVWTNMKTRCYNKKNKAYKDYGGRGVVVCAEWVNSFFNFYKWAMDNGWSQGLEVDKDIKPKSIGLQPLIYSPEMCMIVTSTENGNSTRKNIFITHNGQTKTISQFSREYGVKYNSLYMWHRRGKDISSLLKN